MGSWLHWFSRGAYLLFASEIRAFWFLDSRKWKERVSRPDNVARTSTATAMSVAALAVLYFIYFPTFPFFYPHPVFSFAAPLLRSSSASVTFGSLVRRFISALLYIRDFQLRAMLRRCINSESGSAAFFTKGFLFVVFHSQELASIIYHFNGISLKILLLYGIHSLGHLGMRESECLSSPFEDGV